MRMRSTGLGKTELVGDISQLEISGDLIILHVQTTKPVRWHVRTGVQRKDLLRLAGMFFSFSMLKYLLKVGNHKEPDSF